MMYGHSLLDEIYEEHQGLLEAIEEAETATIVPDVRRFLERISEAGASIPDPRQRSQLRALMRFWGSFIYDRIGEFPEIQLLPASTGLELPSEEEPEPGSRFGIYEILEELGEGGFSTVYKALDTETERLVALKVLHGEQFERAERFRQRFIEREELARELDHPHVIPVYAVGEERGIPYIVMEYVKGGSLADRLSEWFWRPSIRGILEIAHQVADGLEYLHQREIVHRDIKPANILLNLDDHVYLTDFGIAQVVESAFRGMIVGTPEYLSPEAILHPEKVDGRADLYSLGIVLFELLTGEVPFRAGSPVEIMHQQVNQDLPDLPEDLPVSLSRLVVNCLAKSPSERYENASELKNEIERLRESLSEEILNSQPVQFVAPPEVRSRAHQTTAVPAAKVRPPVAAVPSLPPPPTPSPMYLPTVPAPPPPSPPAPKGEYRPMRRMRRVETPGQGTPITCVTEAKPWSAAWLLVIACPQSGRDFRVVGHGIRIGRDSVECDVVLPDEKISRQHAYIERQDITYYLYDLGSANGTFVNGERVTTRLRLKDGDIVRVGDTELIFKVAEVWTAIPPEQHPVEDVLAILIGKSGPQPSTYIIERIRSTIGRSKLCDIMINDASVRTQHALLIYDQPEGKRANFTIYDLATTTGTFVNGEQIVKRRLKHNDIVTIGEVELVFKRLDR